MVLFDPGVGLNQIFYFSAGMKYRRMITPAKPVADLRQAHVGVFLGKIHRHLPRPDDITGAFFG